MEILKVSPADIERVGRTHLHIIDMVGILKKRVCL
jgi:hypothetical protein